MAKSRQLLKRIKSIQSTRKITRTMELVSTSKLKRAQQRIHGTVPYARKLNEMMQSLAGLSSGRRSPLLEVPMTIEKTVVLLVTANRGLCGAYNTNLIKMANEIVEAEQAAGREVELHVSGKKGVKYYKFRNIELAGAYTHLSDVVTFAQADETTSGFIRRFLAGEIQRFCIVFCHFLSPGRQVPACWQILPVEGGAEGKDAGETAAANSGDLILEPDADTILESIVPLAVKVKVLRALVEAQASEHSARRLAMKVATDNAGEVITSLKRVYNKVRQAAITQELAEIMGGVEALKG